MFSIINADTNPTHQPHPPTIMSCEDTCNTIIMGDYYDGMDACEEICTWEEHNYSMGDDDDVQLHFKSPPNVALGQSSRATCCAQRCKDWPDFKDLCLDDCNGKYHTQFDNLSADYGVSRISGF